MTALKHQAAFTALFQAFPGWDIPNESVRMWDALMSDVTPEAALQGAVRLAREAKFPPRSVAEWRALSMQAAGVGKAGLPTAGEAWEELLRNKMNAGRRRYESRPEKLAAIEAAMRWSSEAAQRAARAVNFDSDWEGENIGTLRAQFERYYTQLVEKQETLDANTDARGLIHDGLPNTKKLGP